MQEIENAFQCLGSEGHNVGILTGEPSGVIVVDVDTQNDGVENWTRLLKENIIGEDEDEENDFFDELDTPYVSTPSGGYHFYFRYDSEVMNHLTRYTNIFFPDEESGIDLLCNKAHVVYAGSVYPPCKRSNASRTGKCGCTIEAKCLFKGKKYEWEVSPSETTIKEMPKWMLDLLPKPKRPVKEQKVDKSPVVLSSLGEKEDLIERSLQLFSI